MLGLGWHVWENQLPVLESQMIAPSSAQLRVYTYELCMKNQDYKPEEYYAEHLLEACRCDACVYFVWNGSIITSIII